jgi:Glu-tRNA(Gln) amidotransferase subunit E-like FAD-binding protein
MSDATVLKADALERDVMRKVARMYPAAFSPVLDKHRKTLEKLDKLMQSGATGRARALVRQSGLLRDVAAAIASAGVDAVALIRGEVDGIKEAVSLESEN